MKNLFKIIIILIIFINLFTCGSSKTSFESTSNYDSLISDMRAYINQQILENDIGGITITLVDGQNTVWTEGFGYADRTDSTPVTPETVFSIGSVSKTMASFLIMKLVEDGLLDLDRAITDYLPEFSINQRFPNSVITIRSILTHYSGLPGDILVGGFTKNLNKDWSSWLHDYLKDEYTLQPVGAVWAYNNSGFVILEKVIEKVSGMSLEDYSKQYLFAQTGMTTASWFFDTAIQHNIAYPYYVGVQYEREMTNASTAGSVSVNAFDMANYIKLVLNKGIGKNGTVVNINTFNEMSRVQNSNNPLDYEIKMGLAWFRSRNNYDFAGEIMWHSGATIAYNSECVILTEHELGVFVASNSYHGSPFIAQIADTVLFSALKIKKGIVPPEPVEPEIVQLMYRSENDLQQYNGIYAGGLYGFDSITARDNELVWIRKLAGAAPDTVILKPLLNGRFTANDLQTTQLEITNIAGRNIIIYYSWRKQNRFQKYIYAEKFTPKNISKAWKDRLGTYVFTNPPADDFINIFESYSINLHIKENILIIDDYLTESVYAVDIVSDTLAFTAGVGIRNRGASVRIESGVDGETLWLMGIPYRQEYPVKVIINDIPYPTEKFLRIPYTLKMFEFEKKGLSLEQITIIDKNNNTVLMTIEKEDLPEIHKYPFNVNPYYASDTIYDYYFSIQIPLPLDQTKPETIFHRFIFNDTVIGQNFNVEGAEFSPRFNDTPLVISSPVKGNNWVFMNQSSMGYHFNTLFFTNGKVESAGRFAFDNLKFNNDLTEFFSGDPKVNAAYFSYGETLYAVADGVVVEIEDGRPENDGDAQNIEFYSLDEYAGNYLVLEIEGNKYVLYAHCIPNSFFVNIGDTVAAGDPIGLLGNSGNSTAPHLHFQITEIRGLFFTNGIPFVLKNYTKIAEFVDGEIDNVQRLDQPEIITNSMMEEFTVINFE